MTVQKFQKNLKIQFIKINVFASFIVIMKANGAIEAVMTWI